MRFLSKALFVAALVFVFIIPEPSHAGIFGYSELGIIKRGANKFEFVAPEGETIDEESLLYNAARSAKLMGFAYFLVEIPAKKPAAKSSNKTSDTDGDAVTDKGYQPLESLVSVIVYFYQSPRKRNGMSTIAVTDVLPDEDAPAPVEEPAPEQKPQPQPAKKSEKTSAPDIQSFEETQPVPVEPQPVKQTSKKKMQEDIVVEQAPAPVEVAVEPVKKSRQKQKQEPILIEEPGAPVEAASVISKVEPENVAPIIKPAKSKRGRIPAQTDDSLQAVTQIEDKAQSDATIKPRKKRIWLPEDGGLTPATTGADHDLSSLFN